jgi:hypothetical protein
MIYPDKTITDNPFVDNVLYYSKLMALNSTVKDKDESLLYETVDSLNRRELLISSVEKTSIYEVYDSIPKEILEKYIEVKSNLDLYAESNNALKAHMNSFGVYDRTKIIGDISELAREVYINHYEIMMYYLDSIPDTWFTDNESLYNKCKSSKATYIDLFSVLPEKTVYRIIKTYINNYDNTDIEELSKDINKFKQYIASRTDKTVINTEVDKINNAMRCVFVDHYDMMVERGYAREAGTTWRNYRDEEDAYNHCKYGTATYYELYDLFPEDELNEVLNDCLGESVVVAHDLMRGVDILDEYLKKYSTNEVIAKLNSIMIAKYLDNYSMYMNFEIYNMCLDKLIDYYELSEYLPFETRKMIINSQVEEKTNLQIYSESKSMLNSYLNTLSKDERDVIKANITNDMQEWYPNHHNETNNYYRALIGLPPLDSDGNQYEDTLVHTWDDETKQFKEFGNKFTSRLPDSIYPEIHWKQNICEFDAYDIGILNQYGVLDDWLAECGGSKYSSRYRYLKYLGDDKLDIYTCSKAMDFQLIGVPIIDDTDFQRRFVDTYAVNRDYCIRTVYSDAYKFQSDYYNKFIIVFIMVNTIIDCLTSIPDYFINREVFDSRCIKYLFESYGIPYYSEIPIKYQKAMLKNLNTLIKYKSSTKNMIDICSLFGFSDVKVFGYYLFKERCVDANTGEYEFDEDNQIDYDLDKLYVKDTTGSIKDYNGARFSKLLDYRYYDKDKYTTSITYEDSNGNIKTKLILNNDADVYLHDAESNDFIALKDSDYFTKIKADTSPAELKFIKVPIDEELSEYKNDSDYIIKYDEMVSQDEGDTWDGGDDHDALYNKLLNHEFNAVKTKYISVETVTEMTDLSFQVSYFYNMLFDNMYSEDALTVEIPYIKIGHQFRFMDVVCYLFSLMYLYNGLEDNIMYSPTQILYVKGYNFNSDLNEVMKDATKFQQTNPVTGEIYQDYQKYNIFDVNERIEKDGYDYREAFNNFNIKAFNLECDVDALEKWLNDNYQMSLDDFIVDNTLTEFNQIITLRSFFSLNNSYYQKSIFKNNLYPIAFNQDIKYGFKYVLYEKTIFNDINLNAHEFVYEDKYAMDVICDSSDTLYIMNYKYYVKIGKDIEYAIYNKYNRQSDDTFVKENEVMYIKTKDTSWEFKTIYDGYIGIIDANGNYIFSTDEYYTLDEYGNYNLITDPKYFKDNNGHTILNFGEYYIYDDNGNWVLDPENCYVKITQGDNTFYTLAKNAENYSNITVSEDNCYILHSDGHYVKLTDTDYYVKKDDPNYNGYVYTEEDCYVISSTVTEYYDKTVYPRVYYRKLVDYYSENNYIIYSNNYYVKDGKGNYISQADLINPNNCYYYNDGIMSLVADNLSRFVTYDATKDIKYILILQDNNDYKKYSLNKDTYTMVEDSVRRYVHNSSTDFLTVIINDGTTYDNTKSMMVILNKPLQSYDQSVEFDKYNPEETDGIWDENDWYYDDAYKGEHMWYYKKPEVTIEAEKDTDEDPVGSGFYLEASSYLGEISLEEDCKYYFAFDIETNFTGNIQIVCDADNSVTGSQSNIYQVTRDEVKHITQVFITNSISRPALRFLIYDYDENPINVGDYIIISNIRFVKANSDNYIAQDIPSYDMLQELYRTNEAIYKYLVNLMINTDNIHTYNIYKKLYDSLMISKYNKEAFKIGENTYAKTYTDFLESRDAVLYERLCYFKSLDTDSMHKQVADNIVEVTYAIDDCVDTYSYGYLYSYFPAVSASYIQQYIIKIINFFKSWKVHLLGINTVYKFDDQLDNTIRALECHKLKSRTDAIKSNVFIYGNVKINPILI